MRLPLVVHDPDKHFPHAARRKLPEPSQEPLQIGREHVGQGAVGLDIVLVAYSSDGHARLVASCQTSERFDEPLLEASEASLLHVGLGREGFPGMQRFVYPGAKCIVRPSYVPDNRLQCYSVKDQVAYRVLASDPTPAGGFDADLSRRPTWQFEREQAVDDRLIQSRDRSAEAGSSGLPGVDNRLDCPSPLVGVEPESLRIAGE